MKCYTDVFMTTTTKTTTSTNTSGIESCSSLGIFLYYNDIV